MLTFQDFEKESDKAKFVQGAIMQHKNSDKYKMAVLANKYDAQQNETIYNVARTIFGVDGVQVEDFTASNSKIASNFFNRLNTQRCMYSLGSGVSFIDPWEARKGEPDKTKEALGKHFDHTLREAGYHALIHGESYLMWNADRVYEFKVTEFVPLDDENDGSMMAGIRFWQIDKTKPLNAVLYEKDGYTRYSTEDGELKQVAKKRAYIMKYQYTEAGDIVAVEEENYPQLPIVRMYGSRLRQSTLVGMREAIDAYDLINSGFANDLQDCAQIYWIVENYGGMEDDDLRQFLDRLKLNHIANIDSSAGGKVTPYNQDVPVTGRKTFLDDIRNRIYEDFGALDVHTIAASATNDHIDAAYQPLDENAADFEHWVGDAVSSLLSLQGIDDTPVFRRDRISNQMQQVQMLMLEAPYLDDATLIRKLPNVTPDEYQAIMENRDAEALSRIGIMSEQG